LSSTTPPSSTPDKKPVVDKDGSWMTDKLAGYEIMETRTGWARTSRAAPQPSTGTTPCFSDTKAPKTELTRRSVWPATSRRLDAYVFGIKKMQAAAAAK